VLCEIDGQPVSVRQDGFARTTPGEAIKLAWAAEDEHQFDQATGARLAPQQRRSL
jgi:sn-glycerol 3-phosphate transport system ATP-binding protein